MRFVIVLVAVVCAGVLAAEATCKIGTTMGVCVKTADCSSRKGKANTSSTCKTAGTTCCTGMKCKTGAGTCGEKAKCKDSVVSGLCPGPSSITCCRPIDKAAGARIVSYAKAMVGQWPYSWYGGDKSGATKGAIQYTDKSKKKIACDDRNVKGFDCSGLTLYAVYKGVGKSLSHQASAQYSGCSNKVAYANRLPGDLVFFGSPIHHVAVVDTDVNYMIEAPEHDDSKKQGTKCVGKKVCRSSIRSSHTSKVCRYW